MLLEIDRVIASDDFQAVAGSERWLKDRRISGSGPQKATLGTVSA